MRVDIPSDPILWNKLEQECAALARRCQGLYHTLTTEQIEKICADDYMMGVWQKASERFRRDRAAFGEKLIALRSGKRISWVQAIAWNDRSACIR